MKNIIPVNNFTAPVTVLEDGDPVIGGSSEPTAQALTNRTENLNSRLAVVELALTTSLAKNVADGVLGLNSNKAVDLTATGGNADALKGTGNGSGAGLSGVGGATNGDGVQGQGTGSGDGVQGTGGATSGAVGLRGIGGSTNGIGVRGDGVGTGVGGYFDGAGDGTGASDDAVQVAQNIRFAGSNPAKTTGFSNRLTALNLPKCWGRVNHDGSSVLSFVEGFNVASVTDVATGLTRITFATAMADANYSVIVFGFNGQGTFCVASSRTTTKFDVGFYAGWSNSGDTTYVNAAFDFVVFGRQ